MNIDPRDHCKERITLSGMYPHIMQMVVIEYPVVDPFGSSTIIIDFFVLFRTPGNRCVESDIPGRFGVDTPSVRGIGAAFAGRTFFLFAAGCRTTPFASAASGTESPVDHAESGLTDGCTMSGFRVRNSLKVTSRLTLSCLLASRKRICRGRSV